MTATGKQNSEKGNEVQRFIAEKYEGINVRDGHDIIFPCSDTNPIESLAEVKSFSSYYVQRSNGKEYHYPNVIKVDDEKHEKLKNDTDKTKRMPFYIFVLKPRNDNGEEADKKEWIEACMTWENVDKMLNNPEITRKITNNCSKWRGYDCIRHYSVIRDAAKHIFGR